MHDILYLWHTAFGCFWRLHFVQILFIFVRYYLTNAVCQLLETLLCSNFPCPFTSRSRLFALTTNLPGTADGPPNIVLVQAIIRSLASWRIKTLLGWVKEIEVWECCSLELWMILGGTRQTLRPISWLVLFWACVVQWFCKKHTAVSEATWLFCLLLAFVLKSILKDMYDLTICLPCCQLEVCVALLPLNMFVFPSWQHISWCSCLSLKIFWDSGHSCIAFLKGVTMLQRQRSSGRWKLPVPQQRGNSKPSKDQRNGKTQPTQRLGCTRVVRTLSFPYAILLWSSTEQWNCELASRKSQQHQNPSLTKGKRMSCCRPGGWSSFSKPWHWV